MKTNAQMKPDQSIENVQFTVWTGERNVAKGYTVEDGRLAKVAAETFKSGTFETVSIAPDRLAEELPEVIRNMTQGQFLTSGVHETQTSGISSLNGITRSKDAFPHPPGAGLMIVDADYLDELMFGRELDVVEALNGLDPAVAKAMKVTSPSASSNILFNGADSGLRGLHVLIPIDDARAISEVLETLAGRAYLAGFCHVKIAKNGVAHPKCLVDPALKTSNQVCFEGGANLIDPAITQHREINFHPGEILRAADVKPLTDKERKKVEKIKQDLKDSVKFEAEAVNMEWRETRIGAMVAKGVAVESATEILNHAFASRDLRDEFPIITDKFGEVTIADILAEPAKYHGATCADPVDPDYGRCKAKIYSNQDKPTIHSVAHGESVTYYLHESGFEDLTVNGQAVNIGTTISTEPSQKRPVTLDLECDKHGRPLATINNVVAATKRPNECGMTIGFDEFRDEIMFHRGNDQWQPFTDEHGVELRMTLAARPNGKFKPISKDMMRDAVFKAAKDNTFDTAKVWLSGHQWDGKPRVETFNSVYLGADDTEYTRAVALYMWSAMAGRILVPGIKADMVPVFVGDQGLKKSTAVAALVPSVDFFTEISFHEKDDDNARKIRGKLVAEIGELRGLHTKELEGIKQFITRTHERWIPKYFEFTTTFPRRLVFIGTTNKEEFLADSTGNRRWLPFAVNECDVEAIVRDRNQLWAEAATLFTINGVMWQAAERLAGAAHENHMMIDAWQDPIGNWLYSEDGFGRIPMAKGYVTTEEILSGALSIPVGQQRRPEQMRVADVMKALGYSNKVARVDGKPMRRWVKG